MKKTLLAFLFASLSLSLSAAHAEEPKLAGLTKQYADKHGLPVRIVKSDLGTRQVERHFVPVLPTTHDDFLATFQEANGAVVASMRAQQQPRAAQRARIGDGRVHQELRRAAFAEARK